MDPARKIKRIRAQNQAIKKEVTKLRAERDDAKEENRAAKLVIEYFRTHNPPKKPSPSQYSSEPADRGQQIPHASIGYSSPHILLKRTSSRDFSDEAITRGESQT